MTDDAVAETTPAPAPAPESEPAPQDNALRREWGEDYDTHIAAARRLAGDIATPELIAAIDRAGLGDDPHFLKAVAQVARRVYAPEAATPAEAVRMRERLDELHALQHHNSPAQRDRYRSEAVQDELAQLYTALHGDGPVVGRARAL